MTPSIYKKDLEKKYGKQAKAVSIEQTLKRPSIYHKFKSENTAVPPALTHRQIAEMGGEDVINWDQMLIGVTSLEPGKKKAYEYEERIEELITALFYPNLLDPQTQTPIHDGMKRVDITFDNFGENGFFKWLSIHFPCPKIFVECKNFGNEIGNPEVDQLATRFSKTRGQL